ncbi:MAG: hypothetical protein AMXMBFR64_44660 [Myxococcales bacterium]
MSFNFDLPWNPMDVEQRIGRIHRYGQRDTAQVYNLVLSDTIEGRIFLLLDEKLTEIARALGKLDEHGNVAEDLRSQILGQLSERIRYDQLYQQVLSDPELRRTKVELEVALEHAKEARTVVWQLFQDLDGFNLDDYRPLSDVSAGLGRIVRFLRMDLAERHMRLEPRPDDTLAVLDEHGRLHLQFTTDREVARRQQDVDLLGLDHPLVQAALRHHGATEPERLGAAVDGTGEGPVLVSFWHVESQGGGRERSAQMIRLAVDATGRRLPHLERQADDLFSRESAPPALSFGERMALLHDHVEPMLQREVVLRGASPEGGGFRAELVGLVEVKGG